MSKRTKRRIRRKHAYKPSAAMIAIIIIVLGWAIFAFNFLFKPLIVHFPLISQFFTNNAEGQFFPDKVETPLLPSTPTAETIGNTDATETSKTGITETSDGSSEAPNGNTALTESTFVECEQLGIEEGECNDSAAPAKKGPDQQGIPELVSLSNLHIWVAPDDHASVIAMIVTNQGSYNLINSISVRGVSVPYDSWYYYKVEIASGNNTVLKPDYTPSSVDIDSDGEQETFLLASEPLQLEGGESTILYLLDPVYLESIDSGLTLNVSVQVGNATKVASTTIVTAAGND